MAAAVFLVPLVAAMLLGHLGYPLVSRDDANYLAELDGREIFHASMDVISWTFLVLVSKLTGVSEHALRLTGLAIATASIVILRKRSQDPRVVGWFVISIFPVYLNIYFNQLRLAIALLLFIFFLTSQRKRTFAALAAMLGHASFALLVFPPLVFLLPLLGDVVATFDPDAVIAVKLLAYVTGNELEVPWYFGWELLAISVLLTCQGRLRPALEVLGFLWASRVLAGDLSVDIGRRVLEIGVIAYSPAILFLWREIVPSRPFLWFFACLGILQTAIALGAGVVSTG